MMQSGEMVILRLRPFPRHELPSASLRPCSTLVTHIFSKAKEDIVKPHPNTCPNLDVVVPSAHASLMNDHTLM